MKRVVARSLALRIFRTCRPRSRGGGILFLGSGMRRAAILADGAGDVRTGLSMAEQRNESGILSSMTKSRCADGPLPLGRMPAVVGRDGRCR